MAAHGITPAWAGKSETSVPGSPGCRDHPRVGGERRCPFTPQRPFMGSPPRRRGKGMELPPPVARHGITPA